MSSTRLPLSARPAFLPDEVARREFATVFRGYDPAEVRTFLQQLAEQVADVADRLAQTQRELAQTQERVKNPELDEELVTRLLGEQTAQVLRSAREAANDTRARAEDEVSRSLRETHEVTSRMRQEAETLLAERTEEAERMAETVRKEAAEHAEQTRQGVAQEVAAIQAEVAAEVEGLHRQTQSDTAEELARGRQESKELVEQARTEARALVERTEQRQAELLESLIRKRKIALAQVEELRAGRQRLLKAYKMVRGTLDEVTNELERVEDEARQAAELSGQRSAAAAEITQEELDTVIDLDHYQLDDDVPTQIIDLINGPGEAFEAGNSLFDGDGDGGGGNVGGDGNGDGNGGGEGNNNSTGAGSVGGSSHFWTGTAGVTTMESPVQPVQTPMVVTTQDDSDSADDWDEEPARPSTATGFIIGEMPFRTPDAHSDAALQLRRDSVVAKAHMQAVRRLKRAMQDEQDGLVARLRAAGEQDTIETLLGTVEDQAASYHRAVVKLFREVVRSGATSVEGGRPVERGTVDSTGTAVARGLAIELVDDVRSQLVPVVQQLLTIDQLPDVNGVQSQVAQAYRLLKGDHLDAMVDDRLGGAFDQGATFGRQG